MREQSESLFQLKKILEHKDLAFAVAILGMLLVMLFPMKPYIMDLLIVTNLTLSIGILLVSVYSVRPLDFSAFPVILLVTTLFRLSLNVASIRLILLHGHEGTFAAGHIIESFGQFVVGGNYVVGFVIFVLMIVINFVVITKGSGRVAEVAARFILDAMPGKQMSIDADLNAGLINEEQARERRKQIELEADFYGSMDGASKFVRGDAIAGILITIINILGGLAIGIFQKGLAIEQAAEAYTLMTIGDGLVSQIPALIVSTAAGIVVTKASSGSQLSEELAQQLFSQPKAVAFTAVILFILGIVPGLPLFPFWTLSFIIAAFSFKVDRTRKFEAEEKRLREVKQQEMVVQESQMPPEIEVLDLQVGYGLIQLVDPQKKGQLVDRIFQLRKEFAKELGIVVPKIHIKDNLEIRPEEYSILIKGVPVGKGEILAGYFLAMDPGTVERPINGIVTKEPVFGLNAVWITDSQRESAQLAGYTVVEASTIIATHISEVIKRHASELLGRQELQLLIENLQKTHPKVIEDLIPNILPLGTVLKVCQNLLREQVPIRDLLTIFETLASEGVQIKDSELLTERVRVALSRLITQRLSQGSNELEVMTMSARLEDELIRSAHKTDSGTLLQVDAPYLERLLSAIQKAMDEAIFTAGTPILLCHPLIRSPLKKLLDKFIPNLAILSANEIGVLASVRSLTTVEM